MTMHFSFLKRLCAGVFLAGILASGLRAQTFHTLFKDPVGAKVMDAQQTSDGGYILAGFVGAASVEDLCIFKLDCEGVFEWGRKFSPSSGVSNIGVRVIEKSDGNFLLMGNIGSPPDYDILVASLDPAGNVNFSRLIGGSGEDNGNGMVEASDGGIVISGYTSSFGTDAGTGFSDQYVVKLDATGNVLWSTTFGNAGAIDRANDIVETPDGGFATSGQYLTNGTFYASLTRLDQGGNVQWIRTYGAPNHGTFGYAVTNTANGGFLLGGATTILKTDFTSYTDNLLIRTDGNGDSLWTKVYHGNGSDSFENGTSVIETPSGDIILMCASASYPTTGIVPNKHVAIKTDSAGTLFEAISFNRGGSHYPRLHPGLNGSYIMSGFSNWTGYGLDGITYSGVIARTNSQLLAGCFNVDLTTYTVEQQPGMDKVTPPGTPGTGGTSTPGPSATNFTLTREVLCTTFQPLSVTCSASDTSGCPPLTVDFIATPTGNAHEILWDFGNGTTADSLNPTVIFGDSGTFNVICYVIDTICHDTVSCTSTVTVLPGVTADFTYVPNPEIQAGQEVNFTDASQGTVITWVWDFSDGDSAYSNDTVHVFQDQGTYPVTLTVTNAAGCTDDTTIVLNVIQESSFPNVFSPNGDGINDELVFRGFSQYTLTIFDRWGHQVFHNQDNIQNFWDGKNANGKDCPEGVYFGVFTGTGYDERHMETSFSITLVR